MIWEGTFLSNSFKFVLFSIKDGNIFLHFGGLFTLFSIFVFVYVIYGLMDILFNKLIEYFEK